MGKICPHEAASSVLVSIAIRRKIIFPANIASIDWLKGLFTFFSDDRLAKLHDILNIPAQINNKLLKRKQADAQAPLVSFLYTAILHLPQRAICKSFLLNFTYFTESA